MTLPELTGQNFQIAGTIRTDFRDPDLTGGIPTDLSPSHRRHTRSETGFGTGTCVRRMDGGPRSISA